MSEQQCQASMKEAVMCLSSQHEGSSPAHKHLDRYDRQLQTGHAAHQILRLPLVEEQRGVLQLVAFAAALRAVAA
jgi:hypothetical protein